MPPMLFQISCISLLLTTLTQLLNRSRSSNVLLDFAHLKQLVLIARYLNIPSDHQTVAAQPQH